MDKDIIWLKQNGFSKIEPKWVGSQAERDYYDGTWQAVLPGAWQNASAKVVCKLTFNFEEFTWSGFMLCQSLFDWLDLEAFEVTGFSTAEEAFNEAKRRWDEFMRALSLLQ